MENFKVRIVFEKSNAGTLEITGESREQVLDQLTRSDWYISEDKETAINMRLVTSITISQAGRAKSTSIRGF
ncbi:hypothetical protein ACFFHM_00110 [Halalkalibacter kiskunsagensis]|uniref:Uncharacterized protein n=1 Tax=Halalkalibacter kiskunsagensis TaxID=1548599 RepID=A0ABV6KAX7_9BACI